MIRSLRAKLVYPMIWLMAMVGAWCICVKVNAEDSEPAACKDVDGTGKAVGEDAKAPRCVSHVTTQRALVEPGTAAHPLGDLGSEYWHTHMRNEAGLGGSFERLLGFAFIEKSTLAAATRPSVAVKPSAWLTTSNGRAWQLTDTSTLGLVGDRFSMRVAGSQTLVIDGVDSTPAINRVQLGLAHYFLVPGSTEQRHSSVAAFSADTNMTPGGQSIIRTKRGAARWHGEFFGIPRINILGASVGKTNQSLKFQSNVYGGSTGGPILKNKLYMFADYAGLRQVIGRTLFGYVPSPALASAISAASPELAPVLAAYPAGTQAEPGSTDIMYFKGIGNQIDDEDAVSLRIDDDFAARPGGPLHDQIFLRGNLDAAKIEAPYSGGDGYLNDSVLRHTRPGGAVAGWMHNFGASMTESFRLGYVRGTLETVNVGAAGIPYSIIVSGLTTLAGQQRTYGASNFYSAQDDVLWIHGRSTLSVGASVRRVDLSLSNSDSGRVDYWSTTNFATNAVSWATYSQAVPGNTLREWQASGWAQESWKLRGNLLLSAGLRYELFNHFHETENKAIPFDFSTCGEQGFCPAGAPFSAVRPLDLDPRFAVAWVPSFGPSWISSHVVLRAGGGVYHANGLLSDQSQPIYNEVQNFFLSSAKQQGLTFPITPFLSADYAGIGSARGMNRMVRDAYATEWSTSVEGQLPGQFVAGATYFGANGTHLPTSTYLNLIDPVSLVRPHPEFGQIRYLDNMSSSSFDAMALFLTRSLRNGMQMTAGYNWAHEIDDGAAGDIGSDAPQNPACLSCERSSGDMDVRDTAGLRGIFPFPVGLTRRNQFRSRIMNFVAGDWDMISSFSGRTGRPVNITIDRSSADVPTGYTLRQRPDRVWGTSMRPSHGPSVKGWLNPAAFAPVEGMYGTTARNAALGPSQWRLDSGLRRQIPLPHDVRFLIRADVQNIFNHAQYAQPLTDWSTSQFGQIITPSNPGRVGAGGARAMLISFDVNY